MCPYQNVLGIHFRFSQFVVPLRSYKCEHLPLRHLVLNAVETLGYNLELKRF